MLFAVGLQSTIERGQLVTAVSFSSRLSPESLKPLRSQSFRLLFASRTVSVLGDNVAPIALAFAVFDLHGSAADLGFVLAARTIPLVLFMLAGGVWADRLPRRLLMV